ncbi:MAG: hypothetical protein V7750_17870 [Sneathiella sp.]
MFKDDRLNVPKRRFRGLFLNSIFTFLIVIFSVSPAISDDALSLFQSARIEKAFLSPTKSDGSSILSFLITNESSENLTILGLTSPIHQNSKILVQLTEGNYVELESIPLASEEGLDMTSSHILIQLTNVTRPISENERINFTLVLTSGKLPFTAHVQ